MNKEQRGTPSPFLSRKARGIVNRGLRRERGCGAPAVYPRISVPSAVHLSFVCSLPFRLRRSQTFSHAKQIQSRIKAKTKQIQSELRLNACCFQRELGGRERFQKAREKTTPQRIEGERASPHKQTEPRIARITRIRHRTLLPCSVRVPLVAPPGLCALCVLSWLSSQPEFAANGRKERKRGKIYDGQSVSVFRPRSGTARHSCYWFIRGFPTKA
jgi:hypothetical protein